MPYLYLATNMGKCTLYFSIRAALFNVIIHLDFEMTGRISLKIINQVLYQEYPLTHLAELINKQIN